MILLGARAIVAPVQYFRAPRARRRLVRLVQGFGAAKIVFQSCFMLITVQ